MADDGVANGVDDQYGEESATKIEGLKRERDELVSENAERKEEIKRQKDDLIQPNPQEADEDNSEAGEDAEMAEGVAPPPNPSLQLVIHKLDDLQTFITEFRREHRQQYADLNSRLTSLEDFYHRQHQ